MSIMTTLKKIITGSEPQTVPDLGRNDRCWCGSGRKYKTCHLEADARKRAGMRTTAAQQHNMSRGF
jgi:hypothetical protein